MAKSNSKITAIVRYDQSRRNPRRDGTLGTMICWHDRYRLGDSYSYIDRDTFLRAMLEKAYGKESEKRYMEIKNNLQNPNDTHALAEAVIKDLKDKFLILPVYFYEHGELALSHESFFGRRPYADNEHEQIGWVYMDRNEIAERYGNCGEDVAAAAVRDIMAETELYSHYINGDNFILNIFRNGEMMKSVSGFTGEWQKVWEHMREYVKDEYTHEPSKQEIDDAFGIDSPMIVTASEHDESKFDLRLPNEEWEMEE